MNVELQYKRELATWLECSTDQLFLYWKGRIALSEALRAMHLNPGDEVILPAFTCVVVPNAILYLGARPIYSDVSKTTMNASFEQVQSKVTERTRCIIVQNTFGLSSDIQEIVTFAKSRGIYTIEDCTHGFGGTWRGHANGSLCDFAFYSTQWNKPFSTGVGGMLRVNNPEFRSRIDSSYQQIPTPGIWKPFQLWALIQIHRWFITDQTWWVLQSMYRLLSRIGLVVGSSSGDELTGIQQPANYLLKGSNTQNKAGLKALRTLKSLNEKRRKNSLLYTEFLTKKGKYCVDESLHPDHLFLKYPILVKNRASFLVRAEKAKVRLGEWFLSPLHPVQENLQKWILDISDVPVANNLAQHVVNLPTDTNNPDKVLRFLQKEIDQLL